MLASANLIIASSFTSSFSSNPTKRSVSYGLSESLLAWQKGKNPFPIVSLIGLCMSIYVNLARTCQILTTELNSGHSKVDKNFPPLQVPSV